MAKDSNKCDEGCNGIQSFSDGIFNYCKCKAMVINTIVGANIVDRQGRKPIIDIKFEHHPHKEDV